MIAAIFWDPDPVFWRLPGVGHPIVWYGVLFALGFLIGYFVMRRQVESHLRETCETLPEGGYRAAAGHYTDRLLWLCVIGTVVGARLSHVIFYEWPYYSEHLFDIVKVWKGGLSSHGAAAGVFLAMIIFHRSARARYPTVRFLNLFDMMVLPVALIAVFIRFGNFVNQELIGVPTAVPWAVIFGHPADGSLPQPRHPVQLYEALIYAGVFGVLLLLRRLRSHAGMLAGIFLVLVFGARMWLETYKVHLSRILSQESFVSMGQLLSIPLVNAGMFLIIWSLFRGSRERLSHRQESGH